MMTSSLRKLKRTCGTTKENRDKDAVSIIELQALCHIPAKALTRFKAVSHLWNRQIASPFFAHRQSINHRQVSGFFTEASKDRDFLTLDHEASGVPDPALGFLPEAVTIRSSSHGLLCCVGLSGAYYICNPASKAWKKLPDPALQHGPDPATVLVFEPSLLKFDAEYKVVCACPCRDSNHGYEFEAYDSTTGSWSVFGDPYLGKVKIIPTSGVHSRGVVYWLSSKSVGLISFDLSIGRPKYIYGIGAIGAAENGRLLSAKISDKTLKVFRLKKPTANAVKKKSTKLWEEFGSVDMSPICGVYDQTAFQNSVHNLLYVGDKFLLLLDGRSSMFLYDIEKEVFELLDEDVKPGFRVFGYVNSLVEI